jgi:ABC-type amino acid transport substrate-binding protein
MLFAVVVMFLSIVLVSIFTGIIASRLTVVELQTRIRGIGDLVHSRVGLVRGSPMATFLSERGIAYSGFEDIDHAVATLMAGGLDAVVAGEAELHYLAHTQYPDQLAVLPGALDQGFVAFALPAGSTLRRDIDAALVAILESPEWRRLRHEYLHR